MYRSPSSDDVLFRDEFRIYLESLNLVGSEVFVCGDFNFWVDDVEKKVQNIQLVQTVVFLRRG